MSVFDFKGQGKTCPKFDSCHVWEKSHANTNSQLLHTTGWSMHTLLNTPERLSWL